MGLSIMILGLAVFIGAHVFITLRGQRAAAIARIGEWPYKGAIAVLSGSSVMVAEMLFVTRPATSRASSHTVLSSLVSGALTVQVFCPVKDSQATPVMFCMLATRID